MRRTRVFAFLGIAVAVVLVAALVIRWRFARDLAVAAERATSGSVVVTTRCGTIEVQHAGDGTAMQTAIRHSDRVSALVLVVPIAYKPGTVADSAPPVSDDKEALLPRLLGSDFLFWTALKVARDPLIRHVEATPPEHVAAASEQERARVSDLADRILPLSTRAAALRDDTRLGKRLGPYALESIRVPTLVVSARDNSGHLLVGHDAQVQAEVLKLLVTAAPP